MNGIPAAIAIRMLMAPPTTATHRPSLTAQPAVSRSSRSQGVRLVAPVVALALLVAVVFLGITAVGALTSVDPSTTDQSSRTTYTCTVGGSKVRSFAPCPAVI